MELKRPLVSVVISTYNSREPLKKAITSVINQTYDNIEIIIVDNHSTDDTEQLILEMNVSNILYVCLPENSNGCVPRNRGILASNGRFIAFLHSDDSWLPTKIEYQMASIEQHAKNFDNILCFTDLIIETKHWKKQIRNTSFNEQQMSIMDYMIAQQNIVQTSTYIVSATLAKRSLFNEQLTTHQDWDFCMRLERNGAQFIHCPSFLTVWQCDVR
ncbi:MAG: glycosyltransferase family 2 protein, partial [Solibacillus sp.]